MACTVGIGVLVACIVVLMVLAAWGGWLSLGRLQEKHFDRLRRIPSGLLVGLMAGCVGAVLFLTIRGC